MRDFTHKTYFELLTAIRNAGYEFQTFEDFISAPGKRVVILRHDSDMPSSGELKFAKAENKLGIRASYYFRIPKTFDVNVIKEIVDLGHEIGYHYEDLSVTKGDFKKAIHRFENNLNIFRELYPVKTISMHGRPLSLWNSKDLWEQYDFKNFGIIAEPYISLDYNKVLYLTDTGSRWNGEKMTIRDTVFSQFKFNIFSTFQLIELFRAKELPDLIMLNAHPTRWNDNLSTWLFQYFLQRAKNVIKFYFKKLVVSREKSNSIFYKKRASIKEIETDKNGISTPIHAKSIISLNDKFPANADQISKKRSKYCLLTNDVENTSIRQNKLSEKTGELVLKEGMPLLLELYSKYNIKSTFFFTGQIAKQYPEIVRMILPYGHEVGCHGYSHELNEAFDVLPYHDQVLHLKKAKQILEDICGHRVVSFRAPALRVNNDTPKAMIEAGFLIDSSIASQRLDFLMSFGSRKKLNWITAPRFPYRTRLDNLARKGTTNLVEIPVSAFIMPYIGTSMRVSPFLTYLTRNSLNFETSFTGKPIVFLIHPNEFIKEGDFKERISRRTQNYFKYFFADLLRNKLKVKNLGLEAVALYEKEIRFFSDHKYEFLTMKDYTFKIFPNEITSESQK